MNINQIRKCHELCDALEKEGLEMCFLNAIRGTLVVKEMVWNKRNPRLTMSHAFGSLPEDPHFIALNFV